MRGLIISVISSLLATAIAAAFAFFFRKKVGLLIKQWLINVFDVGTYNIFLNDMDDEYKNDLKGELFKAKFIHVFAGRGRFLFNEPYRTILEKENIEIKILLPDTENYYDVDWIETALDKIAPHKSFRKQVSASVDYIISVSKKNPKVILKTYHALAAGRITVTDNVAYFQPYVKDFSDKSPIYKYKVGSFMYMWAVRYFDSYWEPISLKINETENSNI